MSAPLAVVGGNGPSLERIAPGRVLAGDTVFRTNNFFFEPRHFLGRQVDMAVMAGDPRVAPFMFETLWRCRHDYDLRAWTSHNPAVIRAGRRRFKSLFRPMGYRDAHVGKVVDSLVAHHQRKPMTGTYAVLMAHGLGMDRIVLAGLDLYGATQRYIYRPGPQCRALMGQDLGQRGADERLHAPDLDRAILEALMQRGDVSLSRASDDTMLDDLLPLAPSREGATFAATPRRAPTDWAARSGLYDIRMLRALRHVRGWARNRKQGRGG
ncbi:alpha-2,3-sialyltransferase [Roseovarius sp. EGI FJ00037]|uniref:alpha-2,3-sialyltransferase n=1 Tax=Roseovarius TaxID=74030 RepID=UPI0022A732C8|nr:alpha-2,3-sialyltransferase [Roseovarius sp. EGI FJ00037]MCZ0811381.1 alpha-2,3-sialyltransferase [Roseovarius sp. EGI FJ00037]